MEIKTLAANGRQKNEYQIFFDMKVATTLKFFLLLSLPYQSVLAQPELIDFQNDTTTQDLVRNKLILDFVSPNDFSIAVGVSSFWFGDTTYYDVLTCKAGLWTATSLKISGESGKSIEQSLVVNTNPVGHKVSDQIFTLPPLSYLFTLNNDSLNIDSVFLEHPILDAPYFTLIITNKEKLRIINAYAPHEYLEYFPSLCGSTERKKFIDCIEYIRKLIEK